jgi:hypothetical protein
MDGIRFIVAPAVRNESWRWIMDASDGPADPSMRVGRGRSVSCGPPGGASAEAADGVALDAGVDSWSGEGVATGREAVTVAPP